MPCPNARNARLATDTTKVICVIFCMSLLIPLVAVFVSLCTPTIAEPTVLSLERMLVSEAEVFLVVAVTCAMAVEVVFALALAPFSPVLIPEEALTIPFSVVMAPVPLVWTRAKASLSLSRLCTSLSNDVEALPARALIPNAIWSISR